MEFKEQVKASADIVQVIGEWVPLRKAGPISYKGLCPFHTEKTPSFNVNTKLQIYKCFGCGAGGDVFKFLMEIGSLSFWEALKTLAERYGVPIPKRADYSDEETKLRAGVLAMNEIAVQTFRANLGAAAGAETRAYLERRGVASALAEEFTLGLSDRSGQDLVRRFQREGFTEEQLDKCGLVRKRDDGSRYDYFRNRLMFPIHNESGKVIGFGARALAAGDEPKYLNSPETPVYKKQAVLYNLHRAKESVRRQDRSVLVEGYMDVIGVYGAGIREVVASCGTALTAMQVRSLRRHSDKIVVNFDPDAAGANASERSIQILLDEAMVVRILELDEDLDPDEYVKKNGADAYRARLAKASSYFYWLADRARVKFDMKTGEGKVAALKFLMPALQRITDKIERATIANDVAGYLGIEPGLVLEQFRKAAAGRRDMTAPGKAAETPVPATEKLLLQALLAKQEIRREILPQLRPLPSLPQLATCRILETMLLLQEKQGDFRFDELEARLEERDRTLLTSLVFADEIGEEQHTIEQAQACLRHMAHADRESARAALRARAKAAERAGNLEEALRLSRELDQLGR